MTNSTITNNVAQENGAGISISTDNVIVENCIIWGNESNGIVDNVGTSNPYYLPICSYSAIEGYCDGNNNIDISNMSVFVNPSVSAGAEDNTDGVDWHLLPGVICINQGDNNIVEEDYDLDGLPRIACETVDMGCYEFYRVNDIYATTPNSYFWHDSTYSTSGDYNWLGLLSTYCDSIEILHLTVDPIVGINYFYPDTSDQLIIVYPNPTNGVVNVECTMYNVQLEGTEIQVVDMYGKLVRTVETHGRASLQGTIDISDLANGVYFVKLIAEDKTIAVRKVVKQ